MSTPGDSNLDNIIKKNFMTEVQQLRVKKEIQALKELDQNCFKVSLQSSPLGLKIIVNLTKDFILREIPDAKLTFPILFEFLLEPKFPFVFPKLFCKTNFCSPSLSDGRDFVYDVIQRMWNPSIMLRDIVIFIPDFLKKLIALQIPEESQLMGKYYLGHLYNLEDFLTMDSVHVYAGTEMINEQSVNNERYLVIAESYFLNFQSIDKVRNTLRLIGWAQIHSIAKIRKNPSDEKMLVFLWRDSNRKGILIQNIFILDQAKQFLTMFMHMAQKYADSVEAIKKKRDLPESEVTARNYRNMDIEELLGNIEFLESKLEAELNIDVINLLMNLYQKAVEYFSALNDPSYSEFMEKMHNLLTREDIQIILKSAETDQPGSPSVERLQVQNPIQNTQVSISNKREDSQKEVDAKKATVSAEETNQKEEEIVSQEPERNVEESQKNEENNDNKEDEKTHINESNPNENENKAQEENVIQNNENKEEELQPQNTEEEKVEENQTIEDNKKENEEKEVKEEAINEPSSKVEEQESKEEEKTEEAHNKENEKIQDEPTLKEENPEINEKDKELKPEKEENPEKANDEESKNLNEQKEEDTKIKEEEESQEKTNEENKNSNEQKEEPKIQPESQEDSNQNYSVANNDDMFDIGDDDD